MSSSIVRASLALAVVVAVFAPNRAGAQCNQPEGLDNGVPCVPPQLNVPQVGARTTSLGICWQDCQAAGRERR